VHERAATKGIVHYLAMVFTFLSISAFAQKENPVNVTLLSLPANSTTVQVKDNIKKGQILSTLRWAEQSNVACFPGTRFEMFNGSHVFYRIALPAASAMTITVTPKDNAQISLYALRQGAKPGDQPVPPNVGSAISCEASYPIYANVPGGRTVKNKDDGTRKVEFTSVRAPYSILIGVAGAKGAAVGEFTLNVAIKPR